MLSRAKTRGRGLETKPERLGVSCMALSVEVPLDGLYSFFKILLPAANNKSLAFRYLTDFVLFSALVS